MGCHPARFTPLRMREIAALVMRPLTVSLTGLAVLLAKGEHRHRGAGESSVPAGRAGSLGLRK